MCAILYFVNIKSVTAAEQEEGGKEDVVGEGNQVRKKNLKILKFSTPSDIKSSTRR